jgi:YD repeat-containing protein
VETPYALTLTMSYDLADNRTKVVDSRGGEVVSTFDGLNRLTSRTLSVDGIAQQKANWAFTASGDRLHLTRQAWDGTTWDTIGTTSYGSDALGRLTSITHADGATTIAKYEYANDDADRITALTINGVSRSYNYDAVDQLTNDNGTTITYDDNGNGTGAAIVDDDANRLTDDGTWTYSYDYEGNLVSKQHQSNNDTWTYAYDHNNRLTQAELRDTPGGTLAASVSFKYDAFGNRLERTETSNCGTTLPSLVSADPADSGAESNVTSLRATGTEG